MGKLDSIGESLASLLIGQDSETGQIPQPKGHDTIDKLITDFEGQGLPDPLNLVMGMLGGIGKSGLNLGKSGSKIIDELRILEKIKARNLKGLENLRKMPGTGEGSMKAADRGFFRNEMERLRNLFK